MVHYSVAVAYMKEKVFGTRLCTPLKEKVSHYYTNFTARTPTSGTTSFLYSPYKVGVPVVRFVQQQYAKSHRKQCNLLGASSSFSNDHLSHPECFRTRDLKAIVSRTAAYFYGSIFFFLIINGIMFMWFYNAFIDLSNGVYGIDDDDAQ